MPFRTVAAIFLAVAVLVAFAANPQFHRHEADSIHPAVCYSLHPADSTHSVSISGEETLDPAREAIHGSADEWQKGDPSISEAISPSGSATPLLSFTRVESGGGMHVPALATLASTPPRAPPV